MPLPHLHIFHPPESRLPGITQWLAETQDLLHGDSRWDGCAFRRVEYDLQASFDVPTQSDIIRRNSGPVILIQNVQSSVRNRLESILAREVSIYSVHAVCTEDIWQACETARQAYEDGEPRIPLHEAIAFLILKKLERMDKWGGKSANKAFLWSDNLPKGGFPKDLVEARDVLNVADVLHTRGILDKKMSQGQIKYALARKEVVQPILDSKSFASRPDMREYFERDLRRVPVRVLNYKD